MGHTEEWGIRHDIWHAWGPGRIARIRPPLHNTTSGGPPRAASRDGREGGADEVVDVGVVEQIMSRASHLANVSTFFGKIPAKWSPIKLFQ